MNLLIRADADGRSGSGHVMRMLALAQACDTATFVAAALPEALHDRLLSEGMQVLTIAAPPGSAADAAETIRLAREREATWVAVDGYQFDGDYQRRLKDAALRLLWIDDQGAAAPYCADIVLNQNLHADAGLYEDRDETTQLLLGPRFALLRREFRRWREWRRPPVESVRRVLVTMGGADPDNVTLKCVRALQQMAVENLEAVIVVGATHPNAAALEEAIGANPAIRLARNVTDMSELMAWADVAVSAGGSTCLELAFFGLPSVVVSLADNQPAVAERSAAAGAALNVGWHEQMSSDTLAQCLSSLLADPQLRASMARRGRKLVDGGGAPRVVEQMLARTLSLRRVREDDCRLLWQWANDPAVREASFSSRPIPWEEHEAWFRERLSSPVCLMYIATDEGSPVGQIRYDVDGDTAVVSVSTSDAFRGRGHGSRLIRLGSQELLATTQVTVIDAYVRPENPASIRAFLKAGFERNGSTSVRGLPAERMTIRKNEVRDEHHD